MDENTELTPETTEVEESPEMTEIKYTFLDDLGTQEFIDIMLELTEISLDDRIVTDITSGPIDDDEHIPSILSIVKAFKVMSGDFHTPMERVEWIKRQVSAMAQKIRKMTETDISIQFVTGYIKTKVPKPDPYTLYFQRDSTSMVTYKLYVWDTEKGWVVVGDTEPDLVHYWKKTDLIGLRDAIYSQTHELILMSDDKIRSKVDAAFDKIYAAKK